MSDKPGEMPQTPAGEMPQNPTPTTGEGEPFDKDRAMELITKLRDENRELAKKTKSLEKLENEKLARERAEMSELERTKAELEQTKKQASLLQRKQLQRETAEKVGLPLALAERLQGETPEELEEDAKKLLEVLPKAETRKPSIQPTNPGATANQGETQAEKLKRLRRPVADPFDPATAKSMGGGVFISDNK